LQPDSQFECWHCSFNGGRKPFSGGKDEMYSTVKGHFRDKLTEVQVAGLHKNERVITGPQQVKVSLADTMPVLNLCANNYLGLANHPAVVEAAERALRDWGYGLASVRFICGTQNIHKQLEERISSFLGTEDTILYSSCFDANGGLFETLLEAEDAVISDELNHASIIDGVSSKTWDISSGNRSSGPG
jgi:glycine C-acetyltransferase